MPASPWYAVAHAKRRRLDVHGAVLFHQLRHVRSVPTGSSVRIEGEQARTVPIEPQGQSQWTQT
eukprot:scaffold932_cov328-Pavlova_lutheri.AAC.23